MILLLAAVGATVAALVESTVVPYLKIGESQPHLVFVLAVIVTAVGGVDRGLTWAFVGGLVLDSLTQRPIGSTAFALILCVGATSIIARGLKRLRPIVPIVATLLLSLVFSMSVFLTYAALRGPIPAADPVSLLLPGAIYDVVVAVLVGPLAIAIADRRADAERVDW
jgi:rod shape-determining protein MreD